MNFKAARNFLFLGIFHQLVGGVLADKQILISSSHTHSRTPSREFLRLRKQSDLKSVSFHKSSVCVCETPGIINPIFFLFTFPSICVNICIKARTRFIRIIWEDLELLQAICFPANVCTMVRKKGASIFPSISAAVLKFMSIPGSLVAAAAAAAKSNLLSALLVGMRCFIGKMFFQKKKKKK
jgi:hypothetical protein